MSLAVRSVEVDGMSCLNGASARPAWLGGYPQILPTHCMTLVDKSQPPSDRNLGISPTPASYIRDPRGCLGGCVRVRFGVRARIIEARKAVQTVEGDAVAAGRAGTGQGFFHARQHGVQIDVLARPHRRHT